MEPESNPNATDPTPAAPPAPDLPDLRAPRLIPDPSHKGIRCTGKAKLGERVFDTHCPPADAWNKVAPWLDWSGALNLPAPYTRERARADYAAGLFLGACMSATDLACLKHAMRGDDVTDDEITEAARLNIQLWWPAILVGLPLD